MIDPNHVLICSGCGASICEGEHYLEVFGEQYCGKCVIKAARVAKKVNEENKEEQ